MQKLFGLFLSFVLVLGLVGCGMNEDPIISTPPTPIESEQIEDTAVEPSSSEAVSTAPTNSTNQSNTTTESTNQAILPQPIIINTTKLESNNLVFDLSWNGASIETDYDLDLLAFMLDSDGDCYDSNGFIFYNNNISFDNAIKLSADIQTGENDLSETMTIDLSLVSEETQRIAIWVCRFYEDEYDMSELDAATLTIKNGDKDLNGCKITEGVSYEVCELVRNENGWSIQEMNLVSEYNLNDICTSYGLLVD